MKLRRAISFLMLSVYLASVCGYAFTILMCHCPHSGHRHNHECKCACVECVHSHDDGISADEGCNCKHKHTTEISLYDIAKHTGDVVKPLVSDCIMTIIDSSERVFASVDNILTEQRKIPLPVSPVPLARGLRAPPVLA